MLNTGGGVLVKRDWNEPLVVCDLEATCWADNEVVSIDEQEIIEIGCVLTTFRGGRVLDEFQTFVRPQRSPVLSGFCKSLTNIRQEDVDVAPLFSDAVEALDQWLDGRAGFWASWGNYDRRLLQSECGIHGIKSRFVHETGHLNLKRAWRRTNKQRQRNGLSNALAFHDLGFEGAHHRALDDARNIARILPFILQDEMEFLRDLSTE